MILFCWLAVANLQQMMFIISVVDGGYYERKACTRGKGIYCKEH